MKVIFDPAKDAANRDKHGVSLAKAAELEWESALTWSDLRRDYREPRQCGLGIHWYALVCSGFRGAC